MEVSAYLHTPGKSLQYPLDMRLGGPQSWSGHSGKEKNDLPLPGTETLSFSL
jgi:hypothetical protein